MYRSFVTCNDPGGVVECGTIRKSNKMEHKIERRAVQRSSGVSLAFKAEEEVSCRGALEHCDSSSFQLLEVSRGTQKLNQMIDSLSKGRSYDGRSKDIAKDLLKGALDLQESLIMLGRLQEATQYTARLKKKDMEKLERRRIDEVRSERVKLSRFRDQDDEMELQKPRHLADGSRDAIEELKRAIRNGFARQNLISDKRNQARSSFDCQQMESASDIPSTSSSQSSFVQSSSSYTSDSCVLQSAPEKKDSSVNLIAKLMGLEDIPSKPSSQTLLNQSAVEENLNQRKPNFDIEKQRLWKAQPAVKMVDSEQRTLKEVLETMHFKGLLRSSSARELKSRSDRVTNSHDGRMSADNVQPIVVMKPQRADGPRSEEPFEPSTWNEGGCDDKMALRKKLVKDLPAPTPKQYKERILGANKIQQRAAAEIIVIKKLRQEEELKDHTKRVDKRAEKDVKTVVQKERLADAKDQRKKIQAEDTAAKKVYREGRTKDQREIVERVEDKEIKTKLRDSPRIRCQEQRKETSGKRVLKIEKVVVTSREATESKTTKPKSVSTLKDQDKRTSFTKHKNPEKGSIIVKNQSKQNNAPKVVLKQRTQANIHPAKERKKKEKWGSDSAAAEQNSENLGSKEDDKCIEMIVGNDSAPFLEEPTSERAEPIPPEEKAIGVSQLEGNNTTHTFEYKKNTRSSEEGDDHIDRIRMDTTISKSINPLKALLLNSSSFTTRAEELFHLDSSCSNILPTPEIYDSEATDPKILLDYANELIEIRSLPDTQTKHPVLPTYMKTSRTSSINQLVDEVCIGVASLGGYADLAQNKFPADCVYAVLERDIMCSAIVSGMWDLGWRCRFSVEDGEQAVNDLEKLLLSDLIDELFT